MLSLGFVQQNVIVSGNQPNTLTVNGANTIITGKYGYTIINNNLGGTISGGALNTTTEYNNAIADLNTIISDIGILTFITYNNTDIGSISGNGTLSRPLPPLPPGNYLFNNAITWDTTLYLSGNGQYVFYFMSTLTIGDPPVGGYMDLQGGVLSDDIFFDAAYDILLNTTVPDSTLYGNFISDLNVLDTSNYNGLGTGNFVINGRYLSTTGNVTISNTTFNNNNIACYTKGSLVLVYDEESNNSIYKNIEDIKQGDKVCVFGLVIDNCRYVLHEMQYVPVKFLGRIIISSIPNEGYPIHFEKDSLGPGLPFKDLEVSQQHRIIKDGKFEICKDIINGNTIFKYSYTHQRYFRTKEKLIYYHLECEEHSIIMVNGVLTETLLDYNKDYKHRFTKIF